MPLNLTKIDALPKDESRISVRIPREWISQIDFICKVTGIHSTRSQFIRMAIGKYLEEQYAIAIEKIKEKEKMDAEVNAIAEDLYKETVLKKNLR